MPSTRRKNISEALDGFDAERISKQGSVRDWHRRCTAFIRNIIHIDGSGCGVVNVQLEKYMLSNDSMKKIAVLLAASCLSSVPTWAQFPRFTGFVGGGFTPAVNPIGSRLDTGWNISAGGGVNANHHFGLMLDFTFDDMGINNTFLRQAQAPAGNVRVWGFTLDPIVHLTQEGPVDLYLTGGGGVYHRTVEYTQPAIATATFFDPWFGFYPAAFTTSQVIGSFGQYKGGLDAGVGFSVQVGRRKAKVFAEARYHHIFTRNVGTDILPVTFGLRW